MNPDFRKVALIAAALGLLVSLFFALRPGDDDESATADDDRPDDDRRDDDGGAARDDRAGDDGGAAHDDGARRNQFASTTSSSAASRRVESSATRSRSGRDVVITVTSDVADEVHVHGYDLMADVAPGAPATIRFTADAPGRFEIELENTGVQIAELEVRP